MTTTDVIKYIRPNILALTPYSTARDDFKGGDISIWIDANESPYDSGVNRYPDPHQKALKQRVAELKGVSSKQIFIGGAGSDEAIDLTYRIFCVPGQDNVVSIAPSYGVYSVAAAVNDVEFRQVQLGEGYSLPIGRLLKATDRRTKLIWICSPNNPTANAFPLEEIEHLVSDFNGIVVVDEAYIDFSSKGSALSILDRYPNLIILQTFSKAWGMASLRVGMAFACEEIARFYAMVKYPYNVNGPTQAEVIRRIDCDISNNVTEIISQRDMLIEKITAMPFVEKVYPSDANFLLVKVNDADRLYDYLIANGIIVRNRSRLTACENTLRITVGTPKENAILLKLLNEYR